MSISDFLHTHQFKFALGAAILTTIGIGMLSGCGKNIDQPREVCAAGHLEPSPRGGGTYSYYACDRYKIGCLEPLVLDSENKTLICRMPEPNEVAAKSR